MDEIGEILGDEIRGTIYTREIWFVILFVLLYGRMYGDADLTVRRTSQRLPASLGQRLVTASEEIRNATDLPKAVLDAIRGASSDLRSRRTRLEFLEAAVG